MNKQQLPPLLKSTLILAIMCAILSGCGDEKLQPLSSTDTILAFGDSLTIGKGVALADSYPSVLESLTDLTVINAGISGETTAEGLLRFDQTLHSENPSLVILLEGGNDIIRNISASTSKNNLEKMILMTKQFGAEVVLVGVPEKNLFSSAHPMYQELATKHDLILIERHNQQPIKKTQI